VWLGSPAGVYSLPWPLPPPGTPARWQPLVYGAPPADSNVVTALAPLADGVLAGTDDGGVVFVGDAGVRAQPFAERAANLVNAGACLTWDGGVVCGTEGAGLLRVLQTSVRTVALRPAGWPIARVSALAPAGDNRLFVGAADGRLALATL
jgi:hypothetical protein